jgi:hypothetical protein
VFEMPQRSFINPLLSGGMAGFSVDVLLFPLDTVKTRLQLPPRTKHSSLLG